MSTGWGTPSQVQRTLNEMLPVKYRTGSTRQWKVTYPDVRLEATVTIAELKDGSSEIVGLAILPIEGSEAAPTVVTADLLRRVPLRQLKRACLSDSLDPQARHFLSIAGEAQGRPGRTPITRDLLERVADTYRAARQAGLSTTKAIMQVEGVGSKAADKYVRLARDEGLLAPASKPARGGKRRDQK